MTDAELFTHAFSANVSTESAHLKHDELITPWNFYKYRLPGTCMELHYAGANRTSQSVCIQEKKRKNYIYDFLKCIQLNSHKYINSQYLPVLVGFVVGPHPTIVNMLLAQ